MYDVAQLKNLIDRSDLEHVASATLLARTPAFAPCPEALSPAVRSRVEADYVRDIYRHQAEAIAASIGGDDVCLATSTASGKSLVFMAAAADRLSRDANSRVLAVYPVRALLQDQVDRWRAFLTPLGMNVGLIDGGVPSEQRANILRNSRVVLMTPDVLHAWMMSHLAQRDVAAFLRAMDLLILDEAHVYEGVFGTNMAYLLRRLQAAAAPYRIICSTATIDRPADFAAQLTGRSFRAFGIDRDTSACAAKQILEVRPTVDRPFDAMVNVLSGLARMGGGRFLAFADSRKMVEQLVSAVQRGGAESADEEGSDATNASEALPVSGDPTVLPYRSGYEADDRAAIQAALAQGTLAGVVSTSALELGLDIGEIDLVVLLGVPPTMKAFWQRIGRAGRRRDATCLLVDSDAVLGDAPDALAQYLARPMEPSYLYLDNRYLQYVHALCAAVEMRDRGGKSADSTAFDTLPVAFRAMVENELDPTHIIPEDLYPLKQRAQGGPHREFALRNGIEQSFQVIGPMNRPLGNLSFAQALREAYPGGIYHYMARPYRVTGFDYRRGEIRVRPERRWTTQPTVQAMVFPDFAGGIRRLHRSSVGYLAEVDLQVSERVIGFTEQRGSKKESHKFGPGSAFYQREINRFFRTTGVCWYFPDRTTISESIAQRILRAFCREFGVQERDLGVGPFHAENSPLGAGKCQGICVFDSTHGSLRLTERLGENFARVVACAEETARAQGQLQDAEALSALAAQVCEAEAAAPSYASSKCEPGLDTGNSWEAVIALGEEGVYTSADGTVTVEVIGHTYTPRGLMYQLRSPQPGARWLVAVRAVQPLNGHTRMTRFNLETGELAA